MADERRPADDGYRDGNPEDVRPRESTDNERTEQPGRGPRGGSGLLALAIVMLLAVAGLLGLWWWTQQEDVTITPPAAEEQVDEAADAEDESEDGLNIPSFRGLRDELEPDDPDETPPADERRSRQPEGSQQEIRERGAPQSDLPDEGTQQPDTPEQPDPGQR